MTETLKSCACGNPNPKLYNFGKGAYVECNMCYKQTKEAWETKEEAITEWNALNE